MDDMPFQAGPDGLMLAVRVVPNARRDAFDGIGADAGGRFVLRVRLAAPPVEGKANRALIAFLAAALGVAASDVRLESGARARVKRLHIAGDGAAIAERLRRMLDAGATSVRR